MVGQVAMEERTVRRVIARLLALAAVAEQAASRSAPIRILVLWLLGRAERVAGDWFLDVAGVLPPPVTDFAGTGSSPADALRMAARLKILAACLAALLPDACGPRHRQVPRALAAAYVAAGRAPARAGHERLPYDTS